MAQKFVICEGKLLMGNVSRHVQLVNSGKDAEKIVGGGYWHIDRNTNTIYFYGSSYDFGVVTKKEFDEAFKQQSLQRFRVVFSEKSLLSEVLKEDYLTNKQ